MDISASYHNHWVWGKWVLYIISLYFKWTSFKQICDILVIDLIPSCEHYTISVELSHFGQKTETIDFHSPSSVWLCFSLGKFYKDRNKCQSDGAKSGYMVNVSKLFKFLFDSSGCFLWIALSTRCIKHLCIYDDLPGFFQKKIIDILSD